ncbi:DUF1801 domain-containing protein [Fulvivirga lutimaris]|uniref:DUF1801 domain-containing protein n=1 Tax=Fulvivirga lutimaris TaxID=1819566 RepID=UPI0012BD58F4|nr:DUF1801 domain-containing protein [Fulvivirga lutimaris]MTI39751.1 DUF1801 domain-containing protein [Fulvivirga lutimaris]
MSENKTKETDLSVTDFINSIDDETKRNDSHNLVKLMQEITGSEPKMWGATMVGFGNYHYKYDSGREGDFFRAGFSPRKTALTLYIMAGFSRYDELMEKLGKYRTGKSCLYVKKLADIDMDVLRELIEASVAYMNKKYPE